MDARALGKAWAGFRQRKRLRPAGEGSAVDVAALEAGLRAGIDARYPWDAGRRLRFPEPFVWFLQTTGRAWRRLPTDTAVYAANRLDTFLGRTESQLRESAQDAEQLGIALYRVGFGAAGDTGWYILCDADDDAFGRVEAWRGCEPWQPGAWCRNVWADLPTFFAEG